MKEEKNGRYICDGDDCFKNVKIDELTERYSDGTIHPLAKLCHDCLLSVNGYARLKRFRKEKGRAERRKAVFTKT